MTTKPPRSTDRCDYDGRTVRIDGKRLLNFGSSSFLGLELRPELAQGARDAMCAYGTASPFSRHDLETPLHAELEERLAQMTGAAGVLVTTSTELAHLGALPALVVPGDAVLLNRQTRKCLQAAVSILRGVPIESDARAAIRASRRAGPRPVRTLRSRLARVRRHGPNVGRARSVRRARRLARQVPEALALHRRQRVERRGSARTAEARLRRASTDTRVSS